jgi:GTPase SAR1 family protein
MQKLQTQEWGEGTQAILEQARHALLESEQQAVRDLAGRLPEDHSSSDDTPISLALAGQYSAGKSTILRALTGRQDIATGVGITTEQTLTLDWNGVRLIDTPGIHTSIRPDHDAVTYDAISQADLLVFVITNELFDDHLGSHFRKLVIDREKGHETILVINKMGRTADGNTPEAREVIVEDLRKPLEPFTPEGLRTTFTDAESALEAREEEEEDLAEMLRRQANMEELVRNLDDLIQDKGLGARHTTILYTIDQVMQDAIANEPQEDPDVDSLVMIYNQNMRVMMETRSHLQRSIHNAIDEAVTQAILAGAEYADNFHHNSSQEQLDEANSDVDIKIEGIWNSLLRRIKEDFTEAIPVMGNRLDELHESHRFRTTMANLNSRKPGPDTKRILTIAQTAAARLGEFGRGTSMSPALGSGASGLARFSGSQAHRAVLGLGHMVGHSFKPWEAVRLARNIGRASAVLSVLSIVLDIGAQIKSEQDEARKDDEAIRDRQKIRDHYKQIAGKMADEARSTGDGYIKEYLTAPLEEMQRYADDLSHARKEQSLHLERLSEVSRQARDLIAEIHVQES